MEITDVRIRLIEDKSERLRGFCTITLDKEFVVRDIKIIDGAKGLFVAMPSRKLADHCPKCGSRNLITILRCVVDRALHDLVNQSCNLKAAEELSKDLPHIVTLE